MTVCGPADGHGEHNIGRLLVYRDRMVYRAHSITDERPTLVPNAGPAYLADYIFSKYPEDIVPDPPYMMPPRGREGYVARWVEIGGWWRWATFEEEQLTLQQEQERRAAIHRPPTDPEPPDPLVPLNDDVVTLIERWGLGFCLGNVVQYVARSGARILPAHQLEDLERAKWYLDREIARLEAETS